MEDFFLKTWRGEYDPLRLVGFGYIGKFVINIGDAMFGAIPIFGILVGLPFTVWHSVALWRCSSKNNAPRAWWIYKALVIISVLYLVIILLSNFI